MDWSGTIKKDKYQYFFGGNFFVLIKTKFVLLFIIFLITFVTIPLNVFAGNNDSLPSDRYTGDAPDKWSYSSHYSGIRVSIYWAPSIEDFENGRGVIQIGKTTDITKTGPRFEEIQIYTTHSIFNYMNQDSKNLGKIFDPIRSIDFEYSSKGKGEIFREDGQDIVALMPDVWSGTKEEWDIWFEGGKDGAAKDYKNIPAIFELCEAEITVDDFKKGIYTERNFK